jgi:uncharacterized membrane protein YhaH (DUF805 family)
MSWYLAVLKNYIGFSGRARRKEYWMFVLFHVVAIFLVTLLDRALSAEQPYLTMVYVAATLLPAIAVVVRRLHDTERPGWWYFISFVPLIGPIVLLVFTASEGNAGPNRYGEDPKRPALANA